MRLVSSEPTASHSKPQLGNPIRTVVRKKVAVGDETLAGAVHVAEGGPQDTHVALGQTQALKNTTVGGPHPPQSPPSGARARGAALALESRVQMKCKRAVARRSQGGEQAEAEVGAARAQPLILEG